MATAKERGVFSQKTHPTQTSEGFGSPAPLTFERLEKKYHLRKQSLLANIAAFVMAAGFCAAGISLTFVLFKMKPVLGIDFAALTSDWLAPGLTALCVGIVLFVIDTMKRKLVCPYPFDVKRDFVRYMFQEGVFPGNLAQHQFRCKVKQVRNGQYRLSFNLDAPGCSFNDLKPHMENVAASFGCLETYSFEENEGRTSRYSRGYRFIFEIVLLSVDKAFAKAGEYRGR